MRLCSEDKYHVRKSADRKGQISSVSGTDARFVLFDLQIFSGGCLSSECNLTNDLFFLFPIVFSIINLIHFFNEKKDGAAGNSIDCFGALIPCYAI